MITIPIFYLLSTVFSLTGWVNGFDFAYSLITYSLTYFLGAYLALYPPKIKAHTLVAILLGCIIFFSAWCAAALKGIIPMNIFPVPIADNGIIAFVMGVCIFILFTRVNIKIRLVNYAASSMFAVYLIHTNKTFIDSIFGFFNLNAFYESNLFFIMPFVYLIVIMAVCIVIDKFREALLNKIKKLSLFTEKQKVS